MALILNIETATPLCSVALAENGKALSMRETLEDKSHAARLTVFIQEVLMEKKIKVKDLDAIAVGKGPGSYTGLRIGVSTAKGMCYGSNKPLIAIGTLDILCKQALQQLAQTELKPGTLLCPMLDARRMEVFTCLFDMEGNSIEPVTAKIIDEHSYREWLSDHPVAFFGSGMEKCRTLLGHPNALFVDGVHPHAASLAILSGQKYNRGEFENTAYFEPFYLKDFIATIPKKGLHSLNK
ncbi:MAG: tRNA (adenosine(37)-N6)-threonylcarbamoyltransferase complex dimerization subunit type 1 TsaB [Bacteroidales bacterium]|nr:tRNA (adenosine(37)-N6)-threonylcarbamoyltransferase complex dimerization subunit type 1 TsaB [Bacteroidales bacterium]